MIMHREFKNLDIDHSAIGLGQSDSDATYYCTPRDATIIGWAGVDGIHFCTIPAFGELVFAVSPMNFGDCVHPIARSFEDLLRLLLSCKDTAALEQCYAWDEEQFRAFLLEYPATEEQQTVLDTVQKKFGLTPIEDVFSYVKTLQAEFDLTKIPYTVDYSDPDMNEAASVEPVEWKVTFDGGFWSTEGESGVEIPIAKTFRWENEQWQVPSVYICDRGLVIDYLMESDSAAIKCFIERWDLLNEDCNNYTREEQDQIEREHPLHARFYAEATLNGKRLQNGRGCGMMWLPESCVPQDTRRDVEMRQVLEHYGLDPDRGWLIRRWSYEWNDGMVQELQSLIVRMERQPENLAGPHFATPAVGDQISLPHPLTGAIFMLTVHEVEQQTLPEHLFRDSNMEYPTHLLAMRYSLEPDIDNSGFMLQDCSDGDHPRQKKRDPNAFGPVAFAGAAVMGVIGGADGPTAVCIGQHAPRLHAAWSSLHFEPVGEVEWRSIFCEKRMENMEINLI